ncbi:MAG: outer membrane protein assembly factor BamD [Hyphococcus sp.]|nr:MAG: outer membrane protein assembly factor BamD [Marinicaulis sp.]
MAIVVFRSGLLIKFLLVLSACVAISACSSTRKKEKFAYVERPVETLYAAAVDQLEKRRYDRAINFFEEVERQHPYSAWARRAMLMKAFTYYRGNDYEEAIEALDQFITLHPGNKDAPYAYYLKAMSFYERITDVGRDQEITENAVAALNDVVRRYPDSEYARDARLKLDLTFDHLAGKEMYIGRFYLKQNKHIAAINRFKTVITKYQTTSHVPEALHRLVEAYLEIGVVDEARAAAAVLGYNYPGTNWYEDSFGLFEDKGIVAARVESDQTSDNGGRAEDPDKVLNETAPSDVGVTIAPPPPGELEDVTASNRDALSEDQQAQ